MKSRLYFMLFVRDGGRWAPQFGDYKRAVVAAERHDYYRDQGVKSRDMLILTLRDDRQTTVNYATIELNREG